MRSLWEQSYEPTHQIGYNRNLTNILNPKMNYKIIHPPPPLADYVKFFWFLEINSSKDKPFLGKGPLKILVFQYFFGTLEILILKESQYYGKRKIVPSNFLCSLL